MAFQAISDPPQCCLRVPLDLFQVSSTSLKHFLERLPRAASTGGQINMIKSKTQALLAPSAGRKVENPCRNCLSFPGVSQQRESTQALPNLRFFPVLKIRGILGSNITNVSLFHLSVHAEKKCCWNKKVDGSN